jgi:hypothetical protein
MEMTNDRNTQVERDNKAKYHKPNLVEYGSLQEYTLGFITPGVEDTGFMNMWLAS